MRCGTSSWCSLKLTISAERIPTIPVDVKLSTEELNGSCISQDNFLPDEISQQVLVMLTTPLSTSRMVYLHDQEIWKEFLFLSLFLSLSPFIFPSMIDPFGAMKLSMLTETKLQGYSCFRLGQTRVLKTTSENISGSHSKGPLSVSFIFPELKKLLLDSRKDGSTFIFLSSGRLVSESFCFVPVVFISLKQYGICSGSETWFIWKGHINKNIRLNRTVWFQYCNGIV